MPPESPSATVEPPAQKRRKAGMLVVVAVLAFKSAMVFQQVVSYLALELFGCRDAAYHWSFGPGGGHVTGIGSCTSGSAIGAAAVGCFAGLLVSVPVLLLYTRQVHPRNRVVAAWLYLFGVASLAEVLSSSIVFAIVGQHEAGVLAANGVPWWLVVIAGVAVFALLAKPVWVTTPYFATELLGHEEHHVHIFQKAIWFKLTVGVGIISLVRFLTT